MPQQHPRCKSLPSPTSIPKQRREPRIQIILTWGRRLRDRGDRSGRTAIAGIAAVADLGIGAVEDVDETPLALRELSRRPPTGQLQRAKEINP